MFNMNEWMNFEFHASYVRQIFFKVWRHMLLDTLPCHKLSHFLGPPPPRAWRTLWTAPYVTAVNVLNTATILDII